MELSVPACVPMTLKALRAEPMFFSYFLHIGSEQLLKTDHVWPELLPLHSTGRFAEVRTEGGTDPFVPAILMPASSPEHNFVPPTDE
ncbi:hypothetical protein CB1_001111024 [Camelus ferus]|nr:hypothetical protein CB1_001111024 [Camelus ferus]